jgi:hypothetical protein
MLSKPYKYLLLATVFSLIQFYWLLETHENLEIHLAGLEKGLSTIPSNPLHVSDNHQETIRQSNLPTTTIPVFYNLYVNPDNQSDVPRVRQLVSEQLSGLTPEIYNPIYVQSIGHPMTIPNTTMIGHHDSGTEMLTLHSLWDYCLNHSDETVLYLHSKGSYHNRHENDLLRRFLTFGAVQWTSTTSTKEIKLPDLCDVLSSRFSPYPHPHTSGNMWMARCRYISKLIHPLAFTDKMEQVPRAPGLKRRFEYYLVGRGRFAAEHWVYSHPSVRPCDTYRGNFSCGYDNLPDVLAAENFDSIATAPRFPYKFYRPLEELKPWTGIQHRWREYQPLYNETPTESWWGWRIDDWKKDARENWSVSLS